MDKVKQFVFDAFDSLASVLVAALVQCWTMLVDRINPHKKSRPIPQGGGRAASASPITTNDGAFNIRSRQLSGLSDHNQLLHADTLAVDPQQVGAGCVRLHV